MDDKLELLQEQERTLRELGKKTELGVNLGRQAELLSKTGKLARATQLLYEAEKLFMETQFWRGLHKVWYDLVALLKKQEAHRELLNLLKRQERFWRAENDDEELAECLYEQAAAAHALGDLTSELALCEEQIPLWRRLGEANRLAMCLGAAAMCLVRTNGDQERALALVTESEQMARTSGDNIDLARALNTKAFPLHALGRKGEALKASIECAQIAAASHNSQWTGLNQPLLEQLTREVCMQLVKNISEFPTSLMANAAGLADLKSSLTDLKIAGQFVRDKKTLELLGMALRFEALTN